MRQAIRDLYDDYVHLLDSGLYERWLELFVEDVDYQVVARENADNGMPLATMRCESRAMLEDRVDAIRNTQFFVDRVMRHFVSGIWAEGYGAGFEVTANFLVTESTQDEPSRIHLVGEYGDRVVEVDGALRFARKHCIYDSPLIPTSLIIPV